MHICVWKVKDLNFVVELFLFFFDNYQLFREKFYNLLFISLFFKLTDKKTLGRWRHGQQDTSPHRQTWESQSQGTWEKNVNHLNSKWTMNIYLPTRTAANYATFFSKIRSWYLKFLSSLWSSKQWKLYKVLCFTWMWKIFVDIVSHMNYFSHARLN